MTAFSWAHSDAHAAKSAWPGMVTVGGLVQMPARGAPAQSGGMAAAAVVVVVVGVVVADVVDVADMPVRCRAEVN